MKKIFIFLLLIMALSLFAGCSSENAGENSTDEDKESTLEYEARDLGGIKIHFLTGWKNQFDPIPGYTEPGDRQLERMKNIEEDYNVEIYVEEETANHSSFLRSRVATGIDIPDFFDISAVDAYGYYKSDMLYAYDDMPEIDLTNSKWGPKDFIQYGNFNGNQYGIFPYDWENMPEYAGVILFNREFMLELGLDFNPYEMQENKNWTWDSFYDLLQPCSSPTDKSYLALGIHVGFDMLMKSVIMSNNVNIITKVNDKYVFNLNNNDAYDAMEYANKIKNSGYAKTLSPEDYVAKKSVFLACESWVGTHTDEWMNNKYPAFNMKDYGIMPFPSGPKATSNTVSAFVHMGRRLIWQSSHAENDKADVALVMNVLFEPLDGSLKSSWKTYADKQVIHHKEGFANFEYMAENCNYDYSVQLNKVNTKLNNALIAIYNGSKTPTAGIEALVDAIQQEIDIEMNGVG